MHDKEQNTPIISCALDAGQTRVIDELKYSSLNRLIRVTAFVIRFVDNVKMPPGEQQRSHLLPEEVRIAMIFWLKIIQQEAFSEYSVSPESWPKGKAQTLGIFRDQQGVFGCSGRIQLADVPYEAKDLVLLPKSGHFTELLVQSYHATMMHTGVAGTLARIRQQFWIIKGRSTAKRIIRNCRTCLRFDGGPFKAPVVPPIPQFRLEQSSPFTYTGVDYLGPLLVRRQDEQSTKVWIFLFTCAATRAVHLEVVEDMSTNQFLLALRRFVAVYGRPLMLVSDNRQQFRTASKMFQKWWRDIRNSEDFRTLALPQGMQWQFIPEMAPWMGGFYERLVGVVKQAMRKSLWSVKATLAELQTVVSEIVSVINSRPLVYVEKGVGSTPLSPAHIISSSRREASLLTPPIADADHNQPLTISNLTARWRQLQATVTNFWKAWRAQYLLSLRERHVSIRQRGTSHWSPQVGTVEHLKQDLPRASWRLGRINSIYTSADGNVRSPTAKLPNGRSVRRPLRLLYPLELDPVSARPPHHSFHIEPSNKGQDVQQPQGLGRPGSNRRSTLRNWSSSFPQGMGDQCVIWGHICAAIQFLLNSTQFCRIPFLSLIM